MKVELLLFLLLTSLACVVERALSAVSCIGSQNKPVDWFIVYKIPRIKDSISPKVKAGEGMMYMDDDHPEWKLLDEEVSSKSQPIHYTLNQIYQMAKRKGTSGKIWPSLKPENTAYLMYNDKMPTAKSSSSKAHAKGDLCFDEISGFWLVHTVPSFPPDPALGPLSYPESGTVYGQILMCVTFGVEQLDAIGSQLKVMNPQLYGYYISPYFKDKSPQLWSLLNNGLARAKPSKITENSEILRSKRGKRFVSFSKSKDFGSDIYETLVAPRLKSSLFVQTWVNGNGNIASTCSFEYSVKNVLTINLEGVKFKDTLDHSKWAISNPDGTFLSPNEKKSQIKSQLNLTPYTKSKNKKDDGEKDVNEGYNDGGADGNNWICVGDINRQKSQASRGGGALCFEDVAVWREFRRLIHSVEDCSG